MKTEIYNEKQIEELIGKYFSGDTSSSEEEIVKSYFLRGPVKEEWTSYRSLFGAIGELRAKPELLPEIKLSEPPEKAGRRLSGKRFMQFGTLAAGIAASVLLFVLLFKNPAEENYVVIDGKKYTDETLIEETFHTSLNNVKLNIHDLLSEMKDEK